MARKSGVKNDLIKCEYCGEMYSTTYRHCPFCNEDGTGAWTVAPEDEMEEEEYEPKGGGKRLASGGGSRGSRGSRQGPSIGAIVGGVLSLILIIAAACIVFSIVSSFLGGEKSPKPTPTPPVTETEPVETEPVETEPVESDPVESETPLPQVTTPSVDIVTPTSFTLSKTDMSFFNPGELWDLKVNMVPADATAEVKWKSSDPNIAAVSFNGRVTAVGKGTCTITATIEGVGEQSCIVRCRFDNATATQTPANTSNTSNGEGSSSAASNLTISRTDFTLAYVGDHWRLNVSGTDSTVTWTSSDPSIATVGSDGMVTAVSKGTCTVTAEVDGQKLECIVRCNF